MKNIRIGIRSNASSDIPEEALTELNEAVIDILSQWGFESSSMVEVDDTDKDSPIVATFGKSHRPIAHSEEDFIKIDTKEFHGHPDYLDLTMDELDLHSRKNRDYTQGGDSLGNFKRVASILSLYPGLDLSKPENVAIVFSLKQMDRALWQISQKFEGREESTDGSMTDVHVYWKIARVLRRLKNVQGQS